PRDVRPPLILLPQLRHRGVLAAVVDEHHLVAAPERIERAVQPVEQQRQAILFVEDRDDYGDRRVHWPRAPRTMSFTAFTTRSTSASSIAGNSGSVTVSRPMRSALGNCPSR